MPTRLREFADCGSSFVEHGLVTTDLLQFARILGNPNEYEKDKSCLVIGKAPLFLE